MKIETAGGMHRLTAVAVMIAMVMLLTSCRSGGEEPAAAQKPGTLENGVYLSGDGRFTVRAEEERWQPADSGVSWELSLAENQNVRISFTPTEGLTKEMITGFETSFADAYVEALREEYPDIRKTEIRIRDGELVGLGMAITDHTGGYRMYQLLYLASDGENGYLITAVFPEEEAALKQEVMQMIETFAFVRIKGS